MKIGTPNYFSPDLCHRLYVDPVTNNIYLNDAILNKNLKVINVNEMDNGVEKSCLMLQQQSTNPMIYFHDNESITYLTIHGVEKLI
jgi:hypothetical protein